MTKQVSLYKSPAASSSLDTPPAPSTNPGEGRATTAATATTPTSTQTEITITIPEPILSSLRSLTKTLLHLQTQHTHLDALRDTYTRTTRLPLPPSPHNPSDLADKLARMHADIEHFARLACPPRQGRGRDRCLSHTHITAEIARLALLLELAASCIDAKTREIRARLVDWRRERGFWGRVLAAVKWFGFGY